MADKDKKDVVTLQKLQEDVASDVLTDAVSEMDVDRELREAGGDPDAITRRGLAVVEEMLERRRLAWQGAAAEKLKTVRSKSVGTRSNPQLSKAQLIERINALRSDSKLGAPIEAAFRKRKPEESTIDELTQLLDEMEMLRELADDDTEADK